MSSRSDRSSTTTGSGSHNNRIPVINLTDHGDRRPAVDPYEDTNPSPAYTRTTSYYETDHELAANHQFYQASDVRRQIRAAPSYPGNGGRYPARYGNMEGHPLTSERPRLEYPVAPSPEPGQRPRNYRSGAPGPSRLIYNRIDRERGDVIYHDPKLPPRQGRRGPNNPFSMATYHPGPTYAEPGSSNTEHGSSSSR